MIFCASTLSNTSLIEEATKCLFRTSLRSTHSTRMCFTVNGHWQVPHSCLEWRPVSTVTCRWDSKLSLSESGRFCCSSPTAILLSTYTVCMLQLDTVMSVHRQHYIPCCFDQHTPPLSPQYQTGTTTTGIITSIVIGQYDIANIGKLALNLESVVLDVTLKHIWVLIILYVDIISFYCLSKTCTYKMYILHADTSSQQDSRYSGSCSSEVEARVTCEPLEVTI